jgi:hypothetical protein
MGACHHQAYVGEPSEARVRTHTLLAEGKERVILPLFCSLTR